ncbi:hypothetical protein AS180_17860 [Priestia veravalensis]|uniref:Uncharacterized protein n=1 Tax=Priestia veravalensis TaxID=1414648 RepID=A0A0V8JHM5_9BACI|nr:MULTISPECIES: hypothetical protein [Priestia]KSU86555.1 hypothetical protein AS180_17860 [Priestia veravalensis]SCC50632.1 hypothetical protein GA0061087_10663 [Priestia flexa]
MSNLMNMFEGARNVEFTGLQYCEEIGERLPVFELTDIPADERNRRAKIQNTKVFIEKHGKEPKDYDEVLAWVYSLIEEADKAENHIAGNDTVFTD